MLASYNAVVALRQRIDKAWANIDVVLKQRHDQLPNLVAAVRGLMAFERDVLTRVTEARAAYAPDRADPRPGRDLGGDDAAVRSLFAVVERYPDIKAGTNVQDLQDEIERLEGDDRRPPRALQRPGLPLQHPDPQFPGAILAPVFGWRPREFFAAEPGATRSPGHRPPVRLTVADADRRCHRTTPTTSSGSSATARPSGPGWAGTPAAPTSR